MVFPVVVLVLDLNEYSEGVLHGHWGFATNFLATIFPIARDVYKVQCRLG
jgi:hypothetical protein